ncbi:unnamed protein product [Cuscuta epithymum]|uniref:SWIM-type domain-containing protein n=1 Tax=Cuscuta epithymum TaxID=186058 RepID=A0AAV0FZI0_9ASTE|nr:unnamed protein product [Cuscuta epithymum]
MAEVFNSVMKSARYLPVTALVELSFYRVNAYFVERRETSKRRLAEGHRYCQQMTELIEKNTEKAKHHKVTIFDIGHGLYQVETGRGGRTVGKGGRKQTVNLHCRHCTCQKLNIYKIPCSHILAVCRHHSLSYDAFVDKFFSSSEYAASYKRVFKPIPDIAYRPTYTGPRVVHDPSMIRAKGRPKAKRLRNEMDEGPKGTVRCGKCKQTGHNRTICARRSEGHVGSSTGADAGVSGSRTD